MLLWCDKASEAAEWRLTGLDEDLHLVVCVGYSRVWFGVSGCGEICVNFRRRGVVSGCGWIVGVWS